MCSQYLNTLIDFPPNIQAWFILHISIEVWIKWLHLPSPQKSYMTRYGRGGTLPRSTPMKVPLPQCGLKGSSSFLMYCGLRILLARLWSQSVQWTQAVWNRCPVLVSWLAIFIASWCTTASRTCPSTNSSAWKWCVSMRTVCLQGPSWNKFTSFPTTLDTCATAPLLALTECAGCWESFVPFLRVRFQRHTFILVRHGRFTPCQPSHWDYLSFWELYCTTPHQTARFLMQSCILDKGSNICRV